MIVLCSYGIDDQIMYLVAEDDIMRWTENVDNAHKFSCGTEAILYRVKHRINDAWVYII